MTPDQFVRFMKLVDISPDTECWIWAGNKPDGLYGHFTVEGKVKKAHRVMFEHFHGPIDEGFVVMHLCDNPPCCNPLHLKKGTPRDNVIDKFQKGRGPCRKGERHPLARLTDEDVRRIRWLAENGSPYPSIARMFNMSRGQIMKIVHRVNWSHVT